MNAVWYYSHNDTKFGPFSDQKLRDLADAGEIVPTDTVWKEGIVKGIAADKVKNLFPLDEQDKAQPETSRPPTGHDDTPADPVNVSDDSSSPPNNTAKVPVDAADFSEPPLPEKVGRPVYQSKPQQQQERKMRAIAGPGIMILSQDGIKVRFKKKCIKCGFEDSAQQSMRIIIGANRSTFFCKKCCKSQQVQFRGTTG